MSNFTPGEKNLVLHRYTIDYVKYYNFRYFQKTPNCSQIEVEISSRKTRYPSTPQCAIEAINTRTSFFDKFFWSHVIGGSISFFSKFLILQILKKVQIFQNSKKMVIYDQKPRKTHFFRCAKFLTICANLHKLYKICQISKKVVFLAISSRKQPFFSTFFGLRKKSTKNTCFPLDLSILPPHFRTKNSAEIFVQFLYKFCTNCTKFDKLQKMCVFTSEQGICTIFFTNFQILCRVENHSCATPKTDGNFRFVTLFYQIFRRRKFVQILSDNFAQNLSKNVGLGQNLSDLQKMCVFLYEGAI